MKSELSGNFCHVMTSLCKSPAEHDADELQKAMKVRISLWLAGDYSSNSVAFILQLLMLFMITPHNSNVDLC